jgi:hypothetical protein
MAIPDDLTLLAMNMADLRELAKASGVKGAKKKADFVEQLGALRQPPKKRTRAQAREIGGVPPPPLPDRVGAKKAKAGGKEKSKGSADKTLLEQKEMILGLEAKLRTLTQENKAMKELEDNGEEEEASSVSGESGDEEDAGVKRLVNKTPPPPPPPPPPPRDPEGKTKACPKCASQWPLECEFCPKCGGCLKPKCCTRCSKVDTMGGPFCAGCGHQLSDTDRTHQVVSFVGTKPGPGNGVPLHLKGNSLSVVFAKIAGLVRDMKYVELMELVPIEITRGAQSMPVADGWNGAKSQVVIVEQHLIQSALEWVTAFTKLTSIARELGMTSVAENWASHLEAMMAQGAAHDWITCASYDACLRRIRAGQGSNDLAWDQRIWELIKAKRGSANVAKTWKGGQEAAPRRTGPTKDERTCNLFNRGKPCFREPDCPFLHMCSKCKKEPKHPATECKK